MLNTELALAFERIADLMEITGGDRFRINSYRNAARTLADLTEDLAKLAAENRLAELPGVGKSTAEKIKNYIDTGKIAVLEELEAKLPTGLPALLKIPGMGPKKALLVHEKLGVTSLDDLKRVVEDGSLAGLPGMGEKSAQKIAEGIAFLASSGKRTPLGVALPAAEAILDQVRKIDGVKRASLAGSLRRGAETIGDVDIVCEGTGGASIVERFTKLPGVVRVLASGDTKGSVTVLAAGGGELQIDLRVVPAESYGAALQYFTGSKNHNVRVREIAVKKKLRLNEYGLFRLGKDGAEERLAGENEEDIYAALSLPCAPPELREDRDELDPAVAGKKLITVEDIRGDLHMHTVASDGRNTVEEMAAAARARGYAYIAICDHSKSSVIANGLTVERMLAQIEMIRQVRKSIPGIEVLVGCECDILPDGSLDYPDEILRQCDLVVASVHAAQSGKGKTSPTERTLAAIANRWVTIIGHPTGRMINKRPAMELDMAKIVAAAAASGTALEVNSHWHRLDLKDLHVRQALEAGVKLAIDTDAHSTEGFALLRFGVLTARRGGASPDDVINTFTPPELKQWIAKKRGLEP